jgi:hypothetical protein
VTLTRASSCRHGGVHCHLAFRALSLDLFRSGGRLPINFTIFQLQFCLESCGGVNQLMCLLKSFLLN